MRTPAAAANEPAQPRFVEDKRVDFGGLAEILASSVAARQWTNFGPVAARLEAHLGETLGLHRDAAVVAAASATAALFAAAGVVAAKRGRPLRWVSSAFGFFSLRIGPFAGRIDFVDCDGAGLPDLAALDRLGDDAWDGLIVTNVFGASSHVAGFREFCERRGKALLVDNAMGLWGFDRSGPEPVAEVVSFHHTKPWGFGEGGCAILPRRDEALFRSLIQFGHRAAPELAPFAANGKMSDLAAAAILMRLESAPEWAERYGAEWRRIAAIAAGAGYRVFCEPAAGNVAGFVALQAPRPVSVEAIARSALPLGKYYPPLADRPVAAALYARMVCVPCHAGMESVPDRAIAAALEELAGGATSAGPPRSAG